MGQIFRLHRAPPSWQRERRVNLTHLRSLDSNKQAGPSWERPGYKEAKRALASIQKAEGQGVPYIPVDVRTRENNKLDPAVQEYSEWLSSHWAEHFGGTANFRTPTTIIILKQVTKPNMVEFVILGPKLANMALIWVARRKVVRQKVRKDKVGFTLQKGLWKQSA